MTTQRREITSAELDAVFQLASVYPDLTALAAEIKDLRQRATVQPALSPEIVAELAELARLRRCQARDKTLLAGLAQSQTALRSTMALVLRSKGFKA